MQNDLARLGLRLILEADTDPRVALPLAIMRGGRDRIGEREESGHRATFRLEAIDQEAVLVVEHLLKPLTRDVALWVAVDGVADAHIIGRDALRHRARGTARLKEVPDHFLAGPNLSERPVGGPIKVDGQGLAGSGGAGRGRGL